MVRFLEKVVVTSNNEIAEDIFLLELRSSGICKSAQPGQFVNIYFKNSPRLFPRPFSIAGIKDGAILILFKVVGLSTELMTSWVEGDEVKILGPLGDSFKIDIEKCKTHVLVGGGVGIAPLLFLRDKLFSSGVIPHFFIGAKCRSSHALLEDSQAQLHLATDDGSLGYSGTIIDLFKSMQLSFPEPVSVYSCGPDMMNRKLARLGLGKDVDIQISFERVMACGLGLCQGCAIKMKESFNGSRYALVCKDGPVFLAKDIELDDS